MPIIGAWDDTDKWATTAKDAYVGTCDFCGEKREVHVLLAPESSRQLNDDPDEDFAVYRRCFTEADETSRAILRADAEQGEEAQPSRIASRSSHSSRGTNRLEAHT